MHRDIGLGRCLPECDGLFGHPHRRRRVGHRHGQGDRELGHLGAPYIADNCRRTESAKVGLRGRSPRGRPSGADTS